MVVRNTRQKERDAVAALRRLGFRFEGLDERAAGGEPSYVDDGRAVHLPGRGVPSAGRADDEREAAA